MNIVNNILKIYQIYAKLGIEICLYMLFVCIKFLGKISCFITIFEKCMKRMYKPTYWRSLRQKKFFKSLLAHISGMLWEIFFIFEIWPLLRKWRAPPL